MKPKHSFFSQAWRKAHQFRIMVTALALLLVVPFFLYRTLENGNSFGTWLDLGLIGLGMLLVILTA
jgi:hypothetical protein